MNGSRVCVVLATFNGERFLPAQIESIQAQSHTDWTLLISDDGSTDRTSDVIAAYCASDSRLECLPPRGGRAGHVGNFEYLFQAALERGAQFIFLADQDDIWLPEKLGSMLEHAEKIDDQPLAIFSDLEVVNKAGQALGGFLAMHGLIGPYNVTSLLRQNPVVGCSMMVNAALLQLALPFPDELQNHDWWLGLCAAATGNLLPIHEMMVMYRQHEQNAVGARGSVSRIFQLRQIVRRQRRVFMGKRNAVDVLILRLQDTGNEVPEALLAWQAQFADVDGWAVPWQLLRSNFKPGSRDLLLLQLLALSPLVRDVRSPDQ